MPIDSWTKSADTWQRAKRSLGGGVSTGMRASMRPHPLFFTSGAGSTITDVDGNSYLDYVLGWGPVILGHGHPAVTEAVISQAPLGATYGAGHALEYEVAERVLSAIPGTERVLWASTGSEAAQIALRLSRAATGRHRFLKMYGHYHGWSDTFLVGYRPDGDGNLASLGSLGQQPTALNDVSLVSFGDLSAAADIVNDPASDIAAIFVEPVLCNSGVIPPPEGYLEGLRELCDRTGTLLVFDEVITGFRMSYGGGTARYGVQPDLIILAKAIAAGYPLSAVVGRAELIDQTTSGVVHAGTYNGNPIVLAAAAATLSVLAEDDVYANFETNAKALAAGMRASIEKHGISGVVNQVGPVLQIALGVQSCNSLSEFLGSNQDLYDDLLVNLLRRGVFALPGGRWYLSTAHTAHDIQMTLSAFDSALTATLQEGALTLAEGRADT